MSVDPGLTVWLTGPPASGKSTSARYLLDELSALGLSGVWIDGDDLRRGVSSDLGFSRSDRDENVRRAGELALMLAKQGIIVVVSLVSPYRDSRDSIRTRHRECSSPFMEVHVSASIEVCEERDPKSLYQKARSRTITHMTGVDDVYEPPLDAELVLETGTLSPHETGTQLVRAVLDCFAKQRGSQESKFETSSN